MANRVGPVTDVAASDRRPRARGDVSPAAAAAAMAACPLGDIEELTLCSYCGRAFDEAEHEPKLLACKHHFCLACARSALAAPGGDARCAHCWKRTELPGGRPERLPTHAAVLALVRRLAELREPAQWCADCGARACRAHPRALRSPAEARALLARDCRALAADLQRLTRRRRDFLLRALDAAAALKLRLEAELAATLEPCADFAAESPAAAGRERERLRARLADAQLQCRLDDLVRGAGGLLEPDPLRRAAAGLGADAAPSDEARESLQFLANYCAARLHARLRSPRRAASASLTNGRCESRAGTDSPGAPEALARLPGAYPLLFFNLEVDGAPFGRVVVEARSDVAPRMARNFAALATGELGLSYRGCAVFQCWENESVITGDFELNNGRGGRSSFEESFFMPDDTRLAAVRGAVGMRRSQKRHDNLGLVGSQFRIVLREMRGFTAIFGYVVEGLELVDRLSRTGDSAGKPQAAILIVGCGQLN